MTESGVIGAPRHDGRAARFWKRRVVCPFLAKATATQSSASRSLRHAAATASILSYARRCLSLLLRMHRPSTWLFLTLWVALLLCEPGRCFSSALRRRIPQTPRGARPSARARIHPCARRAPHSTSCPRECRAPLQGGRWVLSNRPYDYMLG